MPERPCAFHPDRMTLVSCSHCERPICTEDMIPAPVGNQCPVCAGRMREGALGEAAYRVRVKAESVPLLRTVAGKQISHVIIGINVAVFVLMLATGAPESLRTLIRFGALIRPLPDSQMWRLVTSMFVHIGLWHLAFNMFAIVVFGPAIETRYGKGRFLLLYIASGLLGGAASLALRSGVGVAAGASGAVFGILGAWIAFFLRHRAAAGARQQLQSLFMLVGINLLLGLVSSVDNYAHLGGLAGGFVIASAFEAAGRLRGRAPLVAALTATMLIVGIAAVLIVPRTCQAGDVIAAQAGQVLICG